MHVKSPFKTGVRVKQECNYQTSQFVTNIL